MVFLKYVGLFFGVYLGVGMGLMLFVPYSGAIGFVTAIIAVIYYRGKRRIRAEEEVYSKFFEAYLSESEAIQSPSKKVPSRRTRVSSQVIEIDKNEPKTKPIESQNTPQTSARSQAQRKWELLEFLKNIEPKGFIAASDELRKNLPNLSRDQASFRNDEDFKSHIIQTIAKTKNVDHKSIIKNFTEGDLYRALDIYSLIYEADSVSSDEIIVTVNEVLGRPKLSTEEDSDGNVQALSPTEISPVCLKCEYDNPVAAKHCISCGEELAALICPKCRTENIAKALFCMGCGEAR